mgnify:CR=1 FL=1
MHKFFDLINWEDISQNKVTAPYIPFVKNTGDSSNFNFRPSPLGYVESIPSHIDPFLSW